MNHIESGFIARILVGVSTFLVLSAAAATRPAFAVELRIPSKKAVAGQLVNVPVEIDRIDNLAGLKIVVKYDDDAMTYRSTKKAPQANTLIHIVNDKRPGMLVVVMAGARGIKGEKLQILTFIFDVGADVPAGSLLPVDIVESQLMSDQLENIEHDTVGARIEVVGAKAHEKIEDRQAVE
jgi:hypothetical protein